jgi:hypothetical protein
MRKRGGRKREVHINIEREIEYHIVCVRERKGKYNDLMSFCCEEF